MNTEITPSSVENQDLAIAPVFKNFVNLVKQYGQDNHYLKGLVGQMRNPDYWKVSPCHIATGKEEKIIEDFKNGIMPEPFDVHNCPIFSFKNVRQNGYRWGDSLTHRAAISGDLENIKAFYPCSVMQNDEGLMPLDVVCTVACGLRRGGAPMHLIKNYYNTAIELVEADEACLLRASNMVSEDGTSRHVNTVWLYLTGEMEHEYFLTSHNCREKIGTYVSKQLKNEGFIAGPTPLLRTSEERTHN